MLLAEPFLYALISLLEVLYHNWRHALNVTQSMFIMLTVSELVCHHWANKALLRMLCCLVMLSPQTYGLKELMPPKEQLALIIASMCHDLDHRGTNNSFQTKWVQSSEITHFTHLLAHLRSGSPLATLYSSSIMENHHFYHCLLILKAEVRPHARERHWVDAVYSTGQQHSKIAVCFRLQGSNQNNRTVHSLYRSGAVLQVSYLLWVDQFSDEDQ